MWYCMQTPSQTATTNDDSIILTNTQLRIKRLRNLEATNDATDAKPMQNRFPKLSWCHPSRPTVFATKEMFKANASEHFFPQDKIFGWTPKNSTSANSLTIFVLAAVVEKPPRRWTGVRHGHHHVHALLLRWVCSDILFCFTSPKGK